MRLKCKERSASAAAAGQGVSDASGTRSCVEDNNKYAGVKIKVAALVSSSTGPRPIFAPLFSRSGSRAKRAPHSFADVAIGCYQRGCYRKQLSRYIANHC